jgi:hypothetical protein
VAFWRGKSIAHTLPSELMPDARITARIGSPSRMASSMCLTTSMPIPSPRAYPFARESKAKHRLSGLRKPSALSEQKSSGSKMRFVPPTRAHLVLLDSDVIASHARCNAVKELEQAVSTVRDGPRRLLSRTSVLYIASFLM